LGYIHLSETADAEWMKQLVAEQLVTVKTRRGFQKLEWQKLRERNEALDCRVYARAATWIAGADRWSEAMWRDLENQVGEASKVAAEADETIAPPTNDVAGIVRRAPPRQGRRVFRSSYVS
jgi:phage terminase large subunit GpA-like protein